MRVDRRDRRGRVVVAGVRLGGDHEPVLGPRDRERRAGGKGAQGLARRDAVREVRGDHHAPPNQVRLPQPSAREPARGDALEERLRPLGFDLLLVGNGDRLRRLDRFGCRRGVRRGRRGAVREELLLPGVSQPYAPARPPPTTRRVIIGSARERRRFVRGRSSMCSSAFEPACVGATLEPRAVFRPSELALSFSVDRGDAPDRRRPCFEVGSPYRWGRWNPWRTQDWG